MHYDEALSQLHLKRDTSNAVLLSRKMQNNTYLKRMNAYQKDPERPDVGLMLHRTFVILWQPDGTLILNSDGWRTTTTKDRIRNYLPEWTLFSASHKTRAKSSWWLIHGSRPFNRPQHEWVPFFDNIKLSTDGDILVPQFMIAEEWERRKPRPKPPTWNDQVKVFMNWVTTPDTLKAITERPYCDEFALRHMETRPRTISDNLLYQGGYPINPTILTLAIQVDAAARRDWDVNPAQTTLQWLDVMSRGKEPPRFRSTMRRFLSYCAST